MPNTQDIKSWLTSAVARFNEIDALALLLPRRNDKGDYVRRGYGWGGASERAISHRLAVYLERAISPELLKELQVTVDCEFNRHLGAGKVHTIPRELVEIVERAKRTAKPISDDESFYIFSIAPDIILHQRGNDAHNLLIVELKKDSNPEIPEYDHLKLECFTGRPPGYGYRIGARVTAHDEIEPSKRFLEVTAWYCDGTECSEGDI